MCLSFIICLRTHHLIKLIFLSIETPISKSNSRNSNIRKAFGEDSIYRLFQDDINATKYEDIKKLETKIKDYINCGADINYKDKFQENVLFEVINKLLSICCLKYILIKTFTIRIGLQ